MKVNLVIEGGAVKFQWDRPLSTSKKDNLIFRYDVDVSEMPRHLANFMFGIVMSEHFTWNDEPVEFDELTEKELEAVNRHVAMNHWSNPYKKVRTKNPIEITALKIVESKPKDNSQGKVLCANGMGKDGILTINLFKELGFSVRCFMVGNLYKNSKLLEERLITASKFCANKEIQSNVISTNFFDRQTEYKIVPWWVIGLPLAWKYGFPAIVSGIEMAFQKYLEDEKGFYLYRPNASIFSLKYLTEATGIIFSSPTACMTPYNVMKLHFERYPETLKYIRSCMTGYPRCQRCSKCKRMLAITKALEIDPDKAGITDECKIDYLTLTPEDAGWLENVYNKIQGAPFDDWVDKVSSPALGVTWQGQKLGKIFKEHFESHSDDIPQDIYGYYNSPSKWLNWLDRGFVDVMRKEDG